MDSEQNWRMVKTASTITLLAGIWLFISPWVYNAFRLHDAWNSWIVGFVIAALAAIRIGNPRETEWLSWLNCLLGIWAFASPWIYKYSADTGRSINSVCVGVVVVVFAAWSAAATPHSGTPLRTNM